MSRRHLVLGVVALVLLQGVYSDEKKEDSGSNGKGEDNPKSPPTDKKPDGRSYLLAPEFAPYGIYSYLAYQNKGPKHHAGGYGSPYQGFTPKGYHGHSSPYGGGGGGYSKPKHHGGPSHHYPASKHQPDKKDHLHYTKKKIDAHLDKLHKLGNRRLSVEVDYSNTPLEYSYLQKYHNVPHPLTGTRYANGYDGYGSGGQYQNNGYGPSYQGRYPQTKASPNYGSGAYGGGQSYGGGQYSNYGQSSGSQGGAYGGAKNPSGPYAPADGYSKGQSGVGYGQAKQYGQGQSGGYGSGQTAGYGQGQAAGYGQEQAAGYGPGKAAGYGQGQAAGYGQGQAAGYGQGQAAGYGQGQATGYGQGQATGYGQGQATGYGQGQTTGYGQGQAPGYDQGQTGGYGQGQSAGYGQGKAAGYGQGQSSGYGSAPTSQYGPGQSSEGYAATNQPGGYGPADPSQYGKDQAYGSTQSSAQMGSGYNQGHYGGASCPEHCMAPQPSPDPAGPYTPPPTAPYTPPPTAPYTPPPTSSYPTQQPSSPPPYQQNQLYDDNAIQFLQNSPAPMYKSNQQNYASGPFQPSPPSSYSNAGGQVYTNTEGGGGFTFTQNAANSGYDSGSSNHLDFSTGQDDDASYLVGPQTQAYSAINSGGYESSDKGSVTYVEEDKYKSSSSGGGGDYNNAGVSKRAPTLIDTFYTPL